MFDCFQRFPSFRQAIVEIMTAALAEEGVSEETAAEFTAELFDSKEFWIKSMTGEEYAEMEWLEELGDLCEPLANQQM